MKAYSLPKLSSRVPFLLGSTTFKVKERNNGTSNNTYTANMQFNSDTGANYSAHYLNGNGSSATAGATTSTSSMYTALTIDSSTSALGWGVSIIDILDYLDTNKYKTLRSFGGFDANGSGAVYMDSGLWRNTNAITSINLTMYLGNFVQYSQVALYGIKGS